MVLLEPYSDLRGFHFPLLLFSVLFCCLCLSAFCLSYPLRPLLISFLCVSHLLFCRFLQYLSTRHPPGGEFRGVLLLSVAVVFVVRDPLPLPDKNS